MDLAAKKLREIGIGTGIAFKGSHESGGWQESRP